MGRFGKALDELGERVGREVGARRRRSSPRARAGPPRARSPEGRHRPSARTVAAARRSRRARPAARARRARPPRVVDEHDRREPAGVAPNAVEQVVVVGLPVELDEDRGARPRCGPSRRAGSRRARTRTARQWQWLSTTSIGINLVSQTLDDSRPCGSLRGSASAAFPDPGSARSPRRGRRERRTDHRAGRPSCRSSRRRTRACRRP